MLKNNARLEEFSWNALHINSCMKLIVVSLVNWEEVDCMTMLNDYLFIY